MTQYIAFLRAINVGGRNVKMEVLRQAFELLGFSGVNTYIQSGNVIFESEIADPQEIERQIEKRLTKTLEYAVPTFVRTGDELQEIIKTWPFEGTELPDGCVLYISFLRTEPEGKLQDDLVTRSDRISSFHVQGREVYWLRRKHLGETKMTNGDIEKILKMPATRRNVNTLQKIANKFF